LIFERFRFLMDFWFSRCSKCLSIRQVELSKKALKDESFNSMTLWTGSN
jgi:hypothetical protein